MWIERDYKSILLKAAKTFPAVLLTGPRQVGKTSILRKIFPDYGYVTLDIPSVAEQAETNPELFLEEHAGPVIIDEIQYAPSIFRTLKYVIDQQKDSRGRYLLTGSQDFLLMQNVSESLSGRCAVLNLHTLSVREIRRKKKADEFRIMLTGGFPELWANELSHHLPGAGCQKHTQCRKPAGFRTLPESPGRPDRSVAFLLRPVPGCWHFGEYRP